MLVYDNTTTPTHNQAPMVRYATQRPFQLAPGQSFLNLSAPDAITHCLSELFQFKDHATVAAFLRRESYLANNLLPALAQARRYFGETTQVGLEVVQDPEDGDRKLFAYILTPLPVAEALARRDQFDNEWWLEACDQTQGQLIFDIGFI